MNNPQRPDARRDGLVVQEMPNEVLVFDTKSNKAHCLNETAAFVWKACDGKNSVADITRLFAQQTGKSIPEDLVWLAIDQLTDNNLLAADVKADFRGQSRREVIKKIGLAAVVALPIVASLAAPTAALAGICSGVAPAVQCGSTCGDGTRCSPPNNNCPSGTSPGVAVCSGTACVDPCNGPRPAKFGGSGSKSKFE